MRRFSLFSGVHAISRLLYIFPMIFTGLVFLNSCGITEKNSSYFKTLKKDTTLQGFVTNDFESKIQKKDVLGINVSSMNKELDDRFNAGGSVLDTRTSGPGYLVSEKGEISIHFLGTIVAEGLTRKELKQKIEQGLTPYMKEPIINIQYLNHKVTILGEITKPQVISMPEEQMSLIELIVNSGDVKENANKKSIMIIREEKDTKKVKYVNLEDHSIFSSPWYYLQPNDIVYVMPDTEKYIKQENKKRFQSTVAFAASLVSLAAVLLNFILR